MAKGTPKTTIESKSYLEKVERDLQSNQSRLSLVLGALIVLVVGVLIFNYFNKPSPEVGPSQTTEQTESGDVSPENLPGKYTVKEGDTLFLIAEKYYGDGFKYEEIVKANNLTDVNTIEVGKVLEIPRIEGVADSPSPSPAEAPAETPAETAAPTEMPEATTEPTAIPQPVVTEPGITAWGPAITGNTYTVVEGDWLSTIAGRAYGDILAYQKLAQANNILNPDLIYPGQVLTIPR